VNQHRRRPLLDKTSYDAESVMNGPLGLLQYQLVGAAHQDGDGVTRVLYSRHLQHAHTALIRFIATNTFTYNCYQLPLLYHQHFHLSVSYGCHPSRFWRDIPLSGPSVPRPIVILTRMPVVSFFRITLCWMYIIEPEIEMCGIFHFCRS